MKNWYVMRTIGMEKLEIDWNDMGIGIIYVPIQTMCFRAFCNYYSAEMSCHNGSLGNSVTSLEWWIHFFVLL